MDDLRFPDGFVWGLATSAYQIEGAVAEDGRGESIWDRFCRMPGRVADDATGDVACDHYHRADDDVALLADLGVGAYRFSISWSRVQPNGGGPANRRGLDFYDRLVDLLLERDIAATVTLNHWDMPQALQDAGGWTARDTVDRFTEYATAVFDRLGDRVARWITHNEPWCVSLLGYWRGVQAPGIRGDLRAALTAAHHLHLAHGAAVRAFRGQGGTGEIGITLNLAPHRPHTDSDADRGAVVLSDGYFNRWFLDPVLRGSYPADMVDHYTHLVGQLDFFRPGDIATAAERIDFLGVNYYQPRTVRLTPGEDLGWRVIERPDDAPVTAMGWQIAPDMLTELLVRLATDYPDVPLLITENGAALEDAVSVDGMVHDPVRIDFLHRHFVAAHRAVAAGVDLRGYFVWSLMDNFEWALGYRPRFGVVYVDFDTLRRIPKDSAGFVREVFTRNAVPPAPPGRADGLPA
ncbi:MAG TPA: GH1 family beta-glucosidase [Euzebyales bacterium]|nr:GH1 family beta-glucosidase [Euzebyales bacterium]